MQDMRKRKAGLEVKERHGQTCVPGALLVRVDTVQAALALVQPLPWYSPCIGSALALVQPLHWYSPCIGTPTFTSAYVTAGNATKAVRPF